jgi:hypothetical protein
VWWKKGTYDQLPKSEAKAGISKLQMSGTAMTAFGTTGAKKLIYGLYHCAKNLDTVSAHY